MLLKKNLALCIFLSLLLSSLNERGVTSVSASLNEGGVASVSACLGEGGVASVPYI